MPSDMPPMLKSHFHKVSNLKCSFCLELLGGWQFIKCIARRIVINFTTLCHTTLEVDAGRRDWRGQLALGVVYYDQPL